jgi:hypothetical protein
MTEILSQVPFDPYQQSSDPESNTWEYCPNYWRLPYVKFIYKQRTQILNVLKPISSTFQISHFSEIYTTLPWEN